MMYNFPDEVECEERDGLLKVSVGDMSTDFLDASDGFFKRIEKPNVNGDCPVRHISHEIGIKNLLDEAAALLDEGEYGRSIEVLDEVIFYDGDYAEALMVKSHALYAQKHFVKALRHYERAVNISQDLADEKYHENLLEKSAEERAKFSMMKRNIYAGDECFADGEYQKALINYKKSLLIPSQAREKILFKLYNKIATTHYKLNEFEDALMYFNGSLNALNNDYAWYGKGLCEYEMKVSGACESLENAVRITKRQMLKKGKILSELGCRSQALETFEFILENHFKQDEIYEEALKGRKIAYEEIS